LGAGAARFWLVGPTVDLLCFGPGVTVLVTALVLGLRHSGPGGGLAAATVTLWVSWVCVGPHYAATYRRAYGSLERLRAHPWVTLAAPPLLLAAAVLAVRHPATVGLGYFAAYVVWSGYHYSGQSLGLALVYPLRQGARLDATEKRLLAVPLFVSWVLSLLGLFGAAPARNPAYEAVRRAYGGPPPARWLLWLGVCLLAVSFVAVAAVARRRRRRGAPLPWPTWAVLLTQALWFGYGVFDPLFNIMLVPIFHGAQYLAFAGWHACRGPGVARSIVVFAVPVLVGGLAIYPGSFRWLTALPADGLIVAATVASFINLHHFLLDGRIWRLREPAVARSMVA
jgi:hypothetical protein